MNTISKMILAAAVVLYGMVTGTIAQDDATGTPLEDVTQEMKVATSHLTKKATDKQTQQPQEAAVSKLDRLIAALEKEKKSLGGGINPNPTKPANSSNIRKGPGGMGDLHGAREQGNRWGDLPAHERDRILQSMTEGFPPHYQAILEAYYKRLAVEKKAEESEPSVNESKSDTSGDGSREIQSAPKKSSDPAKKVAE